MKVGMIGCGKLGLPVILSIENKGHEVYGYDINPAVYEYVAKREIPYLEEGTPELLAKTNLKMLDSIRNVVAQSDIVFCPVQTPHNPMFEGVTRIPDERMDFDYTFLKAAVKEIADAAQGLEKETTLIVISTVLPGTVEREIKPLLNDYIRFAYNPFFIAMGTTRWDFENPEFVLLGMDESQGAIDKVKKLYATIHNKPVFQTTVKNAELIKVAYNTFISSKISIITTLQQICELTGANIDAVSDAFALATDRLISPKYLRGGMPDGGGCFPFYERVMTGSGMRMICNIKEGDMVLTDKGRFRRVLRVFRRDYDGEIIKVGARGLPETHMTIEHPVLVGLDGRKRVPDGRRNTFHRIVDKLQPSKMVRADELGLDHLTVWPKVKDQERSGLPIEFIELAGWYASEGSCELNSRRGRLRFDLHAKEWADAKRIGELLGYLAIPSGNERGASARVTHKVEGNRRCVRLGNLGLAKMLVQSVGRGAMNKVVPNGVLRGTEIEMQTFLRGLIRGDGHRGKRGVSYSTISPDLAWGAYYIMHRLGLQPTLRVIPPRGMHKEAYEVRVRAIKKANELCRIVGWKEYGNFIDFQVYAENEQGTWRPVRSLSREPYKGFVYNLHVEDDNTFVVGCGAVHNCHPRDNIALSWLSRKLDLPYDWFDGIMIQREKTTEWFAHLIYEQYSQNTYLPVVILGKSFKRGTNLVVGSPSVLLSNILNEKGVVHTMYDPHIDQPQEIVNPAIFFIGCNHPEFETMKFPARSIVIDVWGIVKDQDGVEVRRVGRS